MVSGEGSDHCGTSLVEKQGSAASFCGSVHGLRGTVDIVKIYEKIYCQRMLCFS